MAERQIIRVGDTTSHGGTVLEGFASFKIHGRAAAGVGHKVYCPQCKGEFVIVEGSPTKTFGGVPIAADGMLTSCGATLVASAPNASLETSPGIGRVAFGPSAELSSTGAKIEDEAPKVFDRRFQVLDEATGQPAAHRRYRMTVDGKTFEGMTDAEGITKAVSADEALPVQIEVFGEGV